MVKDSDRNDDEFGSMFSAAFGGQYHQGVLTLPDVVVDFECTLEELYNGCIKKLVYHRRVVNSDGRTTAIQNEERDVEIFKGYDKETVLTYYGYGNEAPGVKTCILLFNQLLANLLLKIKEMKHTHFKRVNKNDLVYTHKISLVDALNSVPVMVNTLDGRKLTISMDEIISPQTVRLVKGEGMPIFNKEDPIQSLLSKEKKGDLFIKFEINFPKFIDPVKKEEIIRLLEN